MFTLVLVTFTPCEVLIKDKTTTLKCESTAATVSILLQLFSLPRVTYAHRQREYLC